MKNKHLYSEDVPKYLTFGERFDNIQHSRLRTHCSVLKEHLHSKGIMDDPHCECGSIESTEHYLLHCPVYNVQRDTLTRELHNYGPLSEQLLLFGDNSKNTSYNEKLFKAVHHFLKTSKRFSTE